MLELRFALHFSLDVKILITNEIYRYIWYLPNSMENINKHHIYYSINIYYKIKVNIRSETVVLVAYGPSVSKNWVRFPGFAFFCFNFFSNLYQKDSIPLIIFDHFNLFNYLIFFLKSIFYFSTLIKLIFNIIISSKYFLLFVHRIGTIQLSLKMSTKHQ